MMYYRILLLLLTLVGLRQKNVCVVSGQRTTSDEQLQRPHDRTCPHVNRLERLIIDWKRNDLERDRVENKNKSRSGECQREQCPEGFQYFSGPNYCYKVVLVGLSWTQSRDMCLQINPRSQLAVVTNQAQNDAIVTYLKTINASAAAPCSLQAYSRWCCGGDTLSFYMAGQQLFDGGCTTPFFWKPNPPTYIPVTYTNYLPHQPDCSKYPGHQNETCLHYFGPVNNWKGSYGFNDVPCSFTGCPICEYAL